MRAWRKASFDRTHWTRRHTTVEMAGFVLLERPAERLDPIAQRLQASIECSGPIDRKGEHAVSLRKVDGYRPLDSAERFDAAKVDGGLHARIEPDSSQLGRNVNRCVNRGLPRMRLKCCNDAFVG